MIVADTNLIAYLLIQGPFTDVAQRVLQRDRDWFAPSLWRHELMNVVATNVKYGSLSEQLAEKAITEAEQFVRDAVFGHPWEAVKLAIQTKSATYDCEFILLARRLGISLITADKNVLKAFPETAISIEQFASGS